MSRANFARVPTIGRALEAWLDEHGPQLAHGTRMRASRYVARELRFFQRTSATGLTPGLLWEYVEREIASGKKPSTIVGGLAWLRRALQLLWRGKLSELRSWEPPRGRAGICPALDITETMSRCRKKYAHLASKPKAFTVEEVRTVLEVAREVDVEFAPMLRLYAGTGMRRSELRALQWDCVDLAAGALEIRRNFSENEPGAVKTGSERTVELSPGCIELLRELYARRTCEYVFHVEGQPFSQAQVGHAWGYTFKRAQQRGVRPGLSLHSFRRTYVSQGRQKMPDAWLQEQVGHSAAMQREYTRTETMRKPDLSWADF